MDTNLIMFIIAAVTVIFVVVLWQGMAVARAEIAGKQTTQYQKLAEQATSAEQKSADAQQKTLKRWRICVRGWPPLRNFSAKFNNHVRAIRPGSA